MQCRDFDSLAGRNATKLAFLFSLIGIGSHYAAPHNNNDRWEAICSAIFYFQFVIFSALFYFSVCRNARAQGKKLVFSWSDLSVGILIVSYGVFLASQLLVVPLWSEESNWFYLSKLIASGDIIHPLRYKSDYPSCFQAWPLAFALYLGGDLLTSSRIISAFWMLLFVYYCARVSKIISKDNKCGFLCLLPAVSVLCHIHFVMSGWHEVVSVPFLTLAPWYYFLRLSVEHDRRSLYLFCLTASIALWTLYTPALAGGVLIILFLIGVAGVPLNVKIEGAGLLTLLNGPLIGWLARDPLQVLNRHRNLFIYGGDYASSIFTSLNERFAAYGKATTRLVEHILPIVDRNSFPGFVELNIDWFSLILAMYGVVALLIADRGKAVVLIVPTIVIFAALITSDATVWRESVLSTPFVMFAIYGLARGQSYIVGLGKRWLSTIFVVLVLLAWGYMMIPRITALRRAMSDVPVEWYLASHSLNVIYQDYSRILLIGSTIPSIAQYTTKALPKQIPSQLIRNDADLSTFLNDSKGKCSILIDAKFEHKVYYGTLIREGAFRGCETLVANTTEPRSGIPVTFFKIGCHKD